MDKLFKVAIRYNDQYGRIEYNPDTKEALVIHPDAFKCREVMDYLTTPKTINTAQVHLLDFKYVNLVPTDSLENLKLALTRMWEATEVFVDWSRPVA
jgi:hypothetical protein